MKELSVYKIWPAAHTPISGSEWAACFDIRASLRNDDGVVYYNIKNEKSISPTTGRMIVIAPGDRALVPSGCIFDLPENESLRIHPRSGLALKSGIILGNCEGIVDADYVNQTYVMLHNTSRKIFIVRDGDRIAQGEVVTAEQRRFVITEDEPEQKTSRDGGFGSTGTS
jgi:dUTP pyrophosphatase